MKVYFYTGKNLNNNSGFSWKIWKIQRQGKVATVWWGPSKIVHRRPVAVGKLQRRSWRFSSDSAAKEDEARRIKEKERRYDRMPAKKRKR